MAGLKNIKIKIQSVNKTRKVTRAMEAVSAVKMRKAQERALTARPYARAALRILASVSGSFDALKHPLVTEGSAVKTGIVLITSDKGLAGSLNSAVIKKVDVFIKEHAYTKADVLFVCIGRRGYEYAAARGYEVVHTEINLADSVGEDEFRHITDLIIGLKVSNRVRDVYFAYTDFRSTFEQIASMSKILPLNSDTLAEIVKNIKPTKGMYAQEIPAASEYVAYTIEPSAEAVLEDLLPKLANVAVYHKLLESKASEHSARMVAMKNATDKAKEVAKELNLAYNKARQASITREVSEITSGIEAMK